MRSKALNASPGVLEIASARQLNPYVSLGGTNINTQRIGSAYVSVQNASYGWVYLYSPGVRRVVDYLSRNISQLSLKLYERISDDEREQAGDHPAARALRDPNPRMPGAYLVQEMVKAHLVYGNAYALKFRPNGSGLVIVPLNPSLVGLVGQSHFSVDAYRIWRPDGTFFDVPPEDMIHWPGTTGEDPRRGESYLETLRQEIAAYAAAQQAITELALSGLVLPGWIERPLEAPEWSEEARKRFEEDWANRAKAGKRKSPVLEEGMKFQQGGVTPEDAELLAGRVFTLDYIASMYGMKNVPPATDEERTQFYADVLPPLTDMFSAILDLQVLKEEFGAEDYYFEFSPEKLMDEHIKTLTSASGRPVMTTNEARAKINLPPIEGGDELVTPLNVVVGDNPKPTPMLNPIQDPNKPPQDGSHRTEDAPTPPGKALEVIDEVWNHNNGHRKAVPLLPRRARASHRRDSWAKQYEQVAVSTFTRQQQSVQSKNGAGRTKAVTDDRWNTELAADWLEVSRRHLRAEGNQAAFRLAMEFDPDQGENWLEAKAFRAAEAINQTTAKHIEEKGIADAFALALSARAPAAGKAYATDIAGFATKAAGQQADVEPTVTIDGGECEVCAPYQGTWALSELEAWPAYHPSCSCVSELTAGVKAVEPDVKLIEAEQRRTVQLFEVFTKALTEGNTEGMKALAKAIAEQKPPQVTNNVLPAETHIHEGAVQTTVEAAQPAEVNFAKGAMQVDSPVTVEAPNVTVEAPPAAELTIAEGAVQVPVTVEAAKPANMIIEKGAVAPHFKMEAPPPPPPAEVNVDVAAPEVNVTSPEVRFGKGAIQVDAPPPANVSFEKGAINVETSPTEVTVEAPPPAEVNVNVEKSGKTNKTVKFSDGRTAEINEEEE